MIDRRALPFAYAAVGHAFVAAAALTLAVSSGELRAQETGDFAVTASPPTAIGVQWHLTQRLAIRPDFTASHVIGNVAAAATTITPGVSLLFFLGDEGPTRAYFAPRLQHQSLRREAVDTWVTWGAAASFGVPYRPRDERIAIFAEVGALAAWYNTDFGGGQLQLVDRVDHPVVHRGRVVSVTN